MSRLSGGVWVLGREGEAHFDVSPTAAGISMLPHAQLELDKAFSIST